MQNVTARILLVEDDERIRRELLDALRGSGFRVAEEEGATWQPVPEVRSRLRCRGQVLATTSMVTYEIHIRELGYRPEPYAIVDALPRNAAGKLMRDRIV